MQNTTIPAATPAIFQFDNSQIRTVTVGSETWFVAADVCAALEIGNVSMAVQRLDEDEVTLSQIEGSHRQTNLVSESGLFSLILRSDKPEAKRFKKWVTSEVLPAIRKTGAYQVQASPLTLFELTLAQMKAQELRINEIAAEVKEVKASVRLENWQQVRLQRAVNDKVSDWLETKKINRSERHYAYPRVWSTIKSYFQVARYNEIPASRYEEALTLIKGIECPI